MAVKTHLANTGIFDFKEIQDFDEFGFVCSNLFLNHLLRGYKFKRQN